MNEENMQKKKNILKHLLTGYYHPTMYIQVLHEWWMALASSISLKYVKIQAET